ncbi:MAG: glycoside hydrolase family 15 protein [Thermoplasmata archaeon]
MGDGINKGKRRFLLKGGVIVLGILLILSPLVLFILPRSEGPFLVYAETEPDMRVKIALEGYTSSVPVLSWAYEGNITRTPNNITMDKSDSKGSRHYATLGPFKEGDVIEFRVFAGNREILPPSRYPSATPSSPYWLWHVYSNRTYAQGWRGHRGAWENGNKTVFMTSAGTNTSRVWLTSTNGYLSEVFWPTVDIANIRFSKFYFLIDERLVPENESGSFNTSRDIYSPLAWTERKTYAVLSGQNKDISIQRTFLVDPDAESVLVKTEIRIPEEMYYNPAKTDADTDACSNPPTVFLLTDVQPDNSIYTTYSSINYSLLAPACFEFGSIGSGGGAGTGDSGKAICIASSIPPAYISTGYSSSSTAVEDIEGTGHVPGNRKGLLDFNFTMTTRGHAVLSTGFGFNRDSPCFNATSGCFEFITVYSFGNSSFNASYNAASSLGLVSALNITALENLNRGIDNDNDAKEGSRNSYDIRSINTISIHAFENRSRLFKQQWEEALRGIYIPSFLSGRERELYISSAITLLCAGDKTYRGAYIASPSVPWGHTKSAYEGRTGYHMVWPRDLYHIANALIDLGLVQKAEEVLEYMLNTLMTPEGTMFQNFWVNGTLNWVGLQMDQVSVPILLAWRLNRTAEYRDRLIKAALFIATRISAPSTQQERWEENSGLSPATLAYEIIALRIAARIASEAGDEENSTLFETKAALWNSSLEAWTLTSKGSPAPFSLSSLPLLNTTGWWKNGSYYERIEKFPGADPDDDDEIGIANSVGGKKAREVVDSSIVEVVRLGLRQSDDKNITNTLLALNITASCRTPVGTGYYRYNCDGYGESGRGRLWPLLTGERGMYCLIAGDTQGAHDAFSAICNFSNEGFFIPEQVWDDFEPLGTPGTGTGSATPLIWAHAEYITLAVSISRGYATDMPVL